MRLKTSFLNDIEVYRKISVKSDYIGTENSYKLINSIKADIQPAENQLKDNPHGETIEGMKNLYISFPADIKTGDRIKHDDKSYEIISVMEYRTHIKAVARLI